MQQNEEHHTQPYAPETLIAPGSSPATATSNGPKSIKRRWLVAGVLLGVLLLGLAVWFFTRHSTPRTASRPDSTRRISPFTPAQTPTQPPTTPPTATPNPAVKTPTQPPTTPPTATPTTPPNSPQLNSCSVRIDVMPEAVCQSILSINKNGLKNNPSVAVDTSGLPNDAVVAVDPASWIRVNTHQGYVASKATYSHNTYDITLTYSDSSGSWKVISYYFK